ncbi:zinc finger and SCAN domain-containing protein 23 [Drosophila sulfurigaster albostrigata]|uniref:zinc finger and SCAN domain-containing protein 23 n=1 Tax=Drosophila sulfurigaster albostrigata TaxID=89887 RepID=UPI002D21AE32|nr:zinc finger and SCAN domain-containing protein 23 [Drosophila sulfurigaster albostrigata]
MPTTTEAATQKWIVCRVCLQQPKEAMGSIFNDDASKDLTNMILECGGVPIKKFDHYPDKICDKCSKNLHIAFKFRRICQRSYKHLRQFIAPVVVEQQQQQQLATEEDAPHIMDVNNEPATTELAEVLAMAGTDEHEHEEEIDSKERLVHVKSEQVEEDGIIEELYDVYEAYEGDIVTEQPTNYEEAQGGDEAGEEEADLGANSISGLSADIEYLEQLEQDQLTESAHEDDIEMQHTSDEEFLPVKARNTSNARATSGVVRRRISTRKTNNTSKTAVAKIKRESNCNVTTTNIILNPDETISFGETIVRKAAGIKTKGGHKILVGDKKEFKYICDICGNMYPSQSRLTEHIKVHSGVKPHECEICGHCFAQAQQLARHMNTHTGNRPYKCSYCPAAFADLSTRNKHHRIHTNERPYECDVCHKTFTYTNTLKFHKMIHTGEKPHVCEICGKGFPQAYKLRNHRSTHDRRVGVVRDNVDVMLPYDTAATGGLEL